MVLPNIGPAIFFSNKNVVKKYSKEILYTVHQFNIMLGLIQQVVMNKSIDL